MSEAPLPNDSATREADGTIKDQATQPTPEPKADGTPTPTPEPKPAEKPADAPKAPEAYADFKLPEGVTLRPEVLTKAHEIFKAAGLTQEAAQSIIDMHIGEVQSVQKAAGDAFEAVRSEWRTKLQADPVVGSKLDTVKAEVGKALDSINDPAIVADFKAVMDLTGVGDHPAFVRMMHHFAQAVNESSHVAGKGPSPGGQTAPGAKPQTLANAMYPNLPSSANPR